MFFCVFFFNDTATTEIYTLSLPTLFRSDQQANAEGVALGVMTRQDIAAAQGKDLEEIFEQLQREKSLADQYGLSFEAEPTEEIVDEEN